MCVKCVSAAAHVCLGFIDRSHWTHKNKISVVSIVQTEAINLTEQELRLQHCNHGRSRWMKFSNRGGREVTS